MLFFSISIWEIVDWTEYFQFHTISLNGCEVWDCFVIEGKEHSVFFYGKSNIVFLLDYCFSLCFFCFCLIIVSLSVPLCLSWIDRFSLCFFCVSFFLFFNSETKSIWQVVWFLHFTGILWRSQKHLLTFEIRTDGKPFIMMEFRFCVLEREREQQRETGVTVRERRGKGISEHMYRSCGCCWRWSGSTECRPPGGGEEEEDQATQSSFPGAGFTRCCCK